MAFMINRIQSNYERVVKLSLFLFYSYLSGLLIFFLTRVVFVLKFGDFSELFENKYDLFHSFITGMRFDTVILTYSFIILFFLIITNLFLKEGDCRIQRIINKVFIYYVVIILSTIVFICICDIFYFQFFSSHFNITALGLKNDETKSIIKSMWVDYPVIRIFLGMILCVIILKKIITFIFINKLDISDSSKPVKNIFFAIFIIGYLFGTRCSFGNVPLEFMEASISSSVFINNIPINGVFAIKNAMDEMSKGEIDNSLATLYQKYNYKNEEDIRADFRRDFLKSNQISKCSLSNDSANVDRTNNDEWLAKNPPNIVFLQMESMSTYFMQLQSEQFNMLGSLQEELKKCIVFKNFTSCRNMTIFSMDGLIAQSQLSPLSQSKFLNVSFPTSSILPFVQNGYETDFITGGRLNWRNLDQFLPRQGFQRLEGGADIQKHCPEAIEEHEWGVYDEYLMQRIVQKLKEKRKNPVFIYGVTITNHTPYKVPKNYKALPVNYDAKMLKLLKTSDEKSKHIFLCYQYMCNSLGWIIHEISTSALGENTIIVATGDHSSHATNNLFGFSDKDLMKLTGVPLICYIPEKYKNRLFIDTARFGSHKDIFPTLYNLGLSNCSFHKSGNNLFSKDTTVKYFGLYEYNTAINKDGCVKFEGQNFTKYTWKGTPGGEIELATGDCSKLNDLGTFSKIFAANNRLETIDILKNKKFICAKVK